MQGLSELSNSNPEATSQTELIRREILFAASKVDTYQL